MKTPPKGYQCDGTGYDGWLVDYNGATLPDVYVQAGATVGQSPTGWAWYGEACGGWQPSEQFNIPYPTWTPPAPFTLAQVKLATWWVPSADWEYNPSWGLLPFDQWPILDPTWTSYLSQGEWVCTQQRRRTRAKRF